MTPGRNDPCPCGSGKKFKKCCADHSSSTAKTSTRGHTNAENYYHQGNALCDQGALDEAVLSYRRALKLNPEFAEVHNNLGDVLMTLEQPEAALTFFRRAVALTPRYAEAHGNMGNALKQLGRLEEAVASYARMLDIDPTVAEAHNNLGNALVALRRFEEAAASYLKALELSPRAVGALANLANALRELGRPQEAVAASRRAIEFMPELADAHRFLGNALFDLAQFDAAAASYEHALILDPDNADVHIALAMVLRQMGRVAEAETSCRRALEIQPKSAAAIAFLGEIEVTKGHFERAESLFRRAISIDPESPEAWDAIARCRKMGDGDAAWLEVAQRLVGKRLAINQEISLRFAIGKYFDDIKNFEQAFTNYRLANELKKRHGIKHDREALSRRVDWIIGYHNIAWLRANRVEVAMSTRPIFIVGMPRSGTTLTEQILASHPAVFGAGELSFWQTAARKYESSAGRGTLAGVDLPRLSREYLEHLQRFSTEALHVVDKMPANTMNLGLIHAALPNARIIHMRRNPIDTCLSVYFQIFSSAHAYANDLEDIAHYYVQYRRLMDHWQRTLPGGSILEVPYEDLVDDPESWGRKLLKFVDLPWDPSVLEFDQTNRTVNTASSWQVRQKINKSAVERWRNYERFVGPLMPLLENP